MDIDQMRETFQEKSIMLAKKALKEYKQTGTTTVRCPICGKNPEIRITNGRTTVRCDCTFILYGEIEF